MVFCKSGSERESMTTKHKLSAEQRESGLVDGCDWPNFKSFTRSFLWCRAALKWFLEKTA